MPTLELPFRPGLTTQVEIDEGNLLYYAAQPRDLPVPDQSTVTEKDIAKVIADMTGIPVSDVEEEETVKLLNLEAEMRKRVIGQEEALKAIATSVRRNRAGLRDPRRPIGSFMFFGPTGVGKTELARTLSATLFETEDALIQIDMSEYMEKFAISRLVGAPPGYVGYDEGGQLTEKVRRKPYSVVLLDEIEKAHPDVFNLLLQILEDGALTDSFGRRVDFKNTVLIMTSNVGAKEVKGKKGLGFISENSDTGYQQMKSKILEAAKQMFNPEFLNRLDEIIVFRQLNRDDLMQIVALRLAGLQTPAFWEYLLGGVLPDAILNGILAYLVGGWLLKLGRSGSKRRWEAKS